MTREEAVAVFAAALNGPTARIGNPWKNTWWVSVSSEDVDELVELGASLDELDITYQTNYHRDEHGTPDKGFVAIYDRESQARLLDALREELDEPTRQRLQDLVDARGPIPPDILARMKSTLSYPDLGPAYLAERLNELRIIYGMRKGPWTAKSVRRALARESELAKAA
jgi:hypothetical protein